MPPISDPPWEVCESLILISQTNNINEREETMSPIKSVAFAHGIWADGSCFAKVMSAASMRKATR